MGDREKQIYLHVGLHKTGTTFLQKNVFRKIQGIDYLHATHQIKALIGTNDTLVISNESFSGICYSEHVSHRQYFTQFCDNLQYLKSLFPRSKVIIGFREPSSIVRSFYKQYLQTGGTMSFELFFSLDSQGLIRKEDLYFSKFYDFAVDLFGLENCFFYDHAQLSADQDLIVQRLLKFMGIQSPFSIQSVLQRENVSIPDNFERILITLNRADNLLKRRFGFSLNGRVFKKFGLTPRIICQKRLPIFITSKTYRDMGEIASFYAKDWIMLKDKITLRND